MAVPKDKDNAERVVIVGMGPGGMTAALEIAEKGKAVLLLENRELFTRVQKVYLNSNSYEYLAALQKKVKEKGIKDDIGDQFLESIEQDMQRVQISDLQEFLENKIKQLYPQLITIKKSENLQVAAVKANNDNPTITYTDRGVTQVLPFSHLIAADGARRNMAKLVEKQNKIPIAFKKLDIQLRHEVHGTVNLDLVNPQALPGDQIKSALELSDLPALRKHGWNKPYLPKMYVWPNTDVNKFYIAGEMPPSFLKLKGDAQQKALESWGKTILQLLYQYNIKDFGLNLYKGNDQKLLGMNKLKATVFPLTLEYVEKNAYDLSNTKGKHVFVQIGDAARNANFYLGHGTNDAIADGIAVAKSFKTDNSIDANLLQEHHLLKKQDVMTEMENMRFYADESEMAVMSEAEKHYLAELTKLNEEAKKIVTEVFNAGYSKYAEIMRNFEKIAILTKNGNGLKFEEIYKITMEIFDEVQSQLRAKHYALVMKGITTKDDVKLLHRETELQKELKILKDYLTAGVAKQQAEHGKNDKVIIEANKLKAESDKFLENVAKWHGRLLQPAEKLQRIEQIEKEIKEIVDKKLKSSEQEGSLDKASKILNQFSTTAKYLKESRQLRMQLDLEKIKREKQDELANNQEQPQPQGKDPNNSMQKNATPDLQNKKTPKESFVKQLIKNYESLTTQNKKPKPNDKSPSESVAPKKPKL